MTKHMNCNLAKDALVVRHTRAKASVLVLVATLFWWAPAAHAAIAFEFDFRGGPTLNPGPFSPTSVMPTPAVSITNPTIIASTPAIAGTSAVSQTALWGLGVFTDPTGGGPQNLNSEDPWDPFGAQYVDAVGTAPNTPAEVLILTLSNMESLLVDGFVTRLTLSYYNTGTWDDLEIFLNDVSQGVFDFPTLGFGVSSLALNIPFADGDVLSVRPLTPVFDESNGFSVKRLEFQADLTHAPEPATFAVWSLLGLCGGYVLRRGRSKA